MSKYSWVIVNQSQPPQFQRLLGLLAESFGPGLFLTGIKHPEQHPLLTVVEGPSYQRSSMKSRLASWAAFTAFAARELARISGRPFILTVTNPPMLPHLGLLLSRTKGWRTGVLVWDLYPDHILQRGWMSSYNPIVRLWNSANRLAYKDASVVITLGQGMAKAIRLQAGSAMPITIIPNWADTAMLVPVAKSKNRFAQTHCSDRAITILYSGNLGASHSLQALLLSAKRLAARPEFEFLIIGEGLALAKLQEQAEELALTNLKFLPYQPWDTVPLSLAAGDISIVSQERASAHLSVPSKTYSALAVGSAVLALTADDSDLANLVATHQVGLVRDPDDVAGITEAILQLADNLDAYKEKARTCAEANYSEDIIKVQFTDVLKPYIDSN